MSEMTEMADVENAKVLIKKFEVVEGMMTTTAAAAFIAVFQELRRRGVSGHWFETGVFKGKSATVLCGSAKKDEEVVLIDVGYHETWNHLNELHRSIRPVVSESEKLEQTFPEITNYFAKTMVFHSDGSHFFSNVYSDMALANKLLKEDGILILDDFWNQHYPQVQAAAYTYLAKFPDHFAFFLIGANKALLCRPSRHGASITYVLKSFIDDMKALDNPVVISKTDAHPNFDILAFEQKRSVDEGSYFGMNIYSHFYQTR
jgi:hypothetical protein